MIKDATISDCGKYRHVLSRTWDSDLPYVQWIMLNPSTADANDDDPTIRRCIDYSKSFGFGGMFVNNLFDIRATNPNVMKLSDNPSSKHNYVYILNSAKTSAITICAWGNHGAHRGQSKSVVRFLTENNTALFCLGLNKSQEPKHPLYLKKNLNLLNYLEGK